MNIGKLVFAQIVDPCLSGCHPNALPVVGWASAPTQHL